MGNICVCCTKRREKKIISLLLIGLDNAGKTVTVKGLAGEPLENVVPTVGVSLINLKYKSFYVKVFDLGGGCSIRGIWHRYFVCAHGIIFVVDSSDFERLNEAKNVLEQVLTHEKITGKPLLVLANKQDCGDALDELDLVEGLQLEEMVNRCMCPTLVETSTAIETTKTTKVDPGIKKGYNWLLNYIIRNYENLNKRVKDDLKQQELQDQLEWLQKLERVRKNVENGIRDEDKIESVSDYEKPAPPEETRENSAKIEVASNHLALIEYEHPRSKSAVHIIKEQLKMANQKKSSIIPKVFNKTAPGNFYGLKPPFSERKERKQLEFARRGLKSADDRHLTSLDLPRPSLVFNTHDSHIDLVDMKKRPIHVRPKSSSCSITWSEP